MYGKNSFPIILGNDYSGIGSVCIPIEICVGSGGDEVEFFEGSSPSIVRKTFSYI